MRFLSDDGNRGYFLTTAPIDGADTTPAQGVGVAGPGTADVNCVDAAPTDIGCIRNLYYFDYTDPTPVYRFVTQIPYRLVHSSGGNRNSLNACASQDLRMQNGHMQVGVGSKKPEQGNCFRGAGDAEHVIFFSRGQLTVDDDDEAGDIFVYDAEADQLTRASAAAPGANPVPYTCNDTFGKPGDGICNADLGYNQTGSAFGPGVVGNFDNGGGWGRGRYFNVAEDPDGIVSVFFHTPSQLVPEDTNGRYDTYQWREGELSLISPGNSDDDSFFGGNSVDGEDVFIFTSARIDPREIDDDDFDIYDVRVGGGFPYTPPATPCDVLAHQCRGAATPAAAPVASPTDSLRGAGNVKPKTKKCGKGKVLRKGKCVKKRGHRKTAANKKGSK